MTIHELKIDPDLFDATVDGLKSYEIRRNDDRDFRVGDILVLRCTKFSSEEMLRGAPLLYSGKNISCEILHVLEGPIYGLEAGWSILSLRRLKLSDEKPGARSTSEVPESCQLAVMREQLLECAELVLELANHSLDTLDARVGQAQDLVNALRTGCQ